MIAPDGFPRLTADNHPVTSPATPDYNCIAWSAGDTERWWQPGLYWPAQTPTGDYGVGALTDAFQALGYEECGLDASVEPGFEKVALYGSGPLYTHAARQLPNGKWTSKLGKAEDIEHDTPEDVAGGLYGELFRIMKRPGPATE
jgi:hypothetical protein